VIFVLEWPKGEFGSFIGYNLLIIGLIKGAPNYAILQKVLNSLEVANRNSNDFSIPGYMTENIDH
jgi:hypothetical protein